MPKASDIQESVDGLSFLLIGENGSGKTKFLGTLPSVYIADCDKGVNTLAGADNVEYDVFRDAPYKGKAMPSKGIYEYGTGWVKLIEKLNEIGDKIDKGTFPYAAIAIDSLTIMSDLCMNHVLVQAKKPGEKDPPTQPSQPNWGTFLRLMRNVIDQFTSWPLIKVVTAHVARVQNPITEQTEFLPLIGGQMQALAPNFFDEVYFCEVNLKPGPNNTKVRSFEVVSEKDQLRKNARSRRGVTNGTKLDWPTIRAIIEKRK